MRKFSRFLLFFFLPATVLTVASAFKNDAVKNRTGYKFPYQQANLTKKAAAAHLLSRFTFGARPGEVDKVVEMGLENWFDAQLNASQPNDSLNERLKSFESLRMSNEQIIGHYTDAGDLAKMAIAEGVFTKQEIADLKTGDKKQYRQRIMAYMKTKGLKPKALLLKELVEQKILRAAYSENQLQELLTSFWFNHFNVSVTKNESSRFVPAYERDVIRPNALGNFEQLLLATATSPAMLTYLDNNKSMVAADNESPARKKQEQRMLQIMESKMDNDTTMQLSGTMEKLKKQRQARGLNENYAREIMELHTLGVDGGYTQNDVTEAARVLTGWMVYPMQGPGRKIAEKFNDRLGAEKLADQGFIHNGDFLFAANRHDFNAKQFLGNPFPEGRGYEEGLALLHVLSTNNATARFICTKLATRFVSDTVPATLIDRMAGTFLKENGNIKAVLISMVSAPEFWNKKALREKIKSPFELAISAVRATNASVTAPYQLYNWIKKMGEQMYAYQAPTGFPDKAKFWINSGALLYRMNFGLAFATGKIPGVAYDANVITNHREPESLEAALKTFGSILMPERDIGETQKRLLPLLNDPEIEKKIAAAADKTLPQQPANLSADADSTLDDDNMDKNFSEPIKSKALTSAAVNQVIGILIGSPEFQRR